MLHRNDIRTLNMTTAFDILGIGNAIVDVVAQADDTFLSRHDMHKGAMTLIDADAAEALYAAMPPARKAVAVRPPTPVPWRRRWARASPISARSPTISWATCSATT